MLMFTLIWYVTSGQYSGCLTGRNLTTDTFWVIVSLLHSHYGAELRCHESV